jgi:hypothetical protein
MNKLYHLSKSPIAKMIVASNDPRANKSNDVFFSPRTPESRAGESSDPRICGCPTVWQCLISCPDLQSERLFIYSFRCCSAIRANKDEYRVEDAEVTREHWITDAVIFQNGGQIALTYEGMLTSADEDRHKIWSWMDGQRKASVDLTKTDDRKIWTNDWQIRL